MSSKFIVQTKIIKKTLNNNRL